MHKKTLVLGAGKQSSATLQYAGEVVTVDIVKESSPTVVHDLSVFPWPFEDGTFDNVIAEHILEHLPNVLDAVKEIARVSKQGGTVLIAVPYFRSKWAAIDPTHIHYFSHGSLDYFIRDHEYNNRYCYTPPLFDMTAIKWNWRIDQTLFQKLMIGIAERWPVFYENKLSPIWPLETLTYFLKVNK